MTPRAGRISRAWIAASSNSGYKGDIPVIAPDELDPMDMPEWLDTGAKSLPKRLIAEPHASTKYAWTLKPSPIPDQTYRVMLMINVIPVDLAGDSTVPWYENDETMVWAVNTQALFHQDDERWTTAEQKLAGMLREDYVKYGRPMGNPVLQLSSKVFARRR